MDQETTFDATKNVTRQLRTTAAVVSEKLHHSNANKIEYMPQHFK